MINIEALKAMFLDRRTLSRSGIQDLFAEIERLQAEIERLKEENAQVRKDLFEAIDQIPAALKEQT